MHLRNGKTLVEMERQKKYSLPQNDAPDREEKPIGTTVGGARTSTSVGVTTHIISQMSVSTVLSEMVAPSP